MDQTDKNLFQIGEVTKALGVTRRMLINYEELGLLTPAVRHDNRGFRYYSADNMVHIRIIRTLQDLGLSLPEIRSYFDDTTHLDEQISRLILLRSQLDKYIAQLKLRQIHTSDPEVRHVTLPEFTAFCRDFHGADLERKTAELRQTYIHTVKHYQIDLHNRMCIQIPIDSSLDGTYIVPVHARLLEYARTNGMTPHGYFSNIYMEGPPTHGINKDAYITQVALPIKFVEYK